jgi:hypothetical protein
MPIYTFDLRDGTEGVEDRTGADLPDRDAALQYAHEVALELMSCRERQTRCWRLDVYEDHGPRVIELPFASIDPTLDHLDPKVRRNLAGLYDRQRSLREVIHLARSTMHESRALVARSRGKPYLAVHAGKKTIRDN